MSSETAKPWPTLFVNGNIHCAFSFLVTSHELVLKTLNLNLVDGLNQRKSSHATERNVEVGLMKGLHVNLLYYEIVVLLVRHAKRMLTLDRIHFVQWDEVVRHNSQHNM